MKKLILASQSPGRKQVLEEEGFIFEIIPSNYEEDMSISLDPKELVLRLSLGKARDVAKNSPDAIIIGADTVGVYNGKILGKPHTKENAKEMLLVMNNDVHSMITGLSIIDTASGKEINQSFETKVYFKNLSEKKIEDYVNTGEGLEKAGGYAYQGLGRNLVSRVEGSETNILGMPLEGLKEILKGL